MSKGLVVRSEKFTMVKCPVCALEHEYDLEFVIDQAVVVTQNAEMRLEQRECVVSCPTKGTQFVVDIPVLLSSGEKLVRIK